MRQTLSIKASSKLYCAVSPAPKAPVSNYFCVIMFSVILKDWHAVASWMHSVETGKVVSLEGYEDWLKVVCGIPEHKKVKTATKKKVAKSSISFPRS